MPPAAADKNAEAAEELVDYEEEEVAEAEAAKGKVRDDWLTWRERGMVAFLRICWRNRLWYTMCFV